MTVDDLGIWQRLRGPFRDFGFGAGVMYAADRVLHRMSDRLRLYAYEMMAQPVPEGPLLPAHKAESFEFREIRRGDPELDVMPARPEIKARRFEQGARCLGAFRKGKLIGYIWFGFDRYEEDEVRCTYRLVEAAESVFDFDVYLFPEHRMGLGFVALWHGANDFLRRRGVRFTFSRMTRFNLASRRAHAHLGWKCIGKVVVLQAWRGELLLATLFPYVSVSFAPNRRVELRLAPPG